MNRLWTPEEDAAILAGRRAGVLTHLIAAELDRPIAATFNRALILKATVQTHTPWTDDDVARLREAMTRDPLPTDKELSVIMGRTTTSLRFKLGELKLTGLRKHRGMPAAPRRQSAETLARRAIARTRKAEEKAAAAARRVARAAAKAAAEAAAKARSADVAARRQAAADAKKAEQLTAAAARAATRKAKADVAAAKAAAASLGRSDHAVSTRIHPTPPRPQAHGLRPTRQSGTDSSSPQRLSTDGPPIDRIAIMRAAAARIAARKAAHAD